MSPLYSEGDKNEMQQKGKKFVNSKYASCFRFILIQSDFRVFKFLFDQIAFYAKTFQLSFHYE